MTSPRIPWAAETTEQLRAIKMDLTGDELLWAAAIGFILMAWRNGPIQDMHGDPRASSATPT